MATAAPVKDIQNKHQGRAKIELRLSGYEALAWKVINGHGYPTSWDEFCEEFDNDLSHADAVRVANTVLFYAQSVRDQNSAGNAEAAALEALRLKHQAAKLMDVSMFDFSH